MNLKKLKIMRHVYMFISIILFFCLVSGSSADESPSRERTWQYFGVNTHFQYESKYFIDLAQLQDLESFDVKSVNIFKEDEKTKVKVISTMGLVSVYSVSEILQSYTPKFLYVWEAGNEVNFMLAMEHVQTESQVFVWLGVSPLPVKPVLAGQKLKQKRQSGELVTIKIHQHSTANRR